MDNSIYLLASETTEKKFPNGLNVPAKEFHDLANLFASIASNSKKIDKLKKLLIYKGAQIDGKPFVALEQPQAELLHAMMGVVTEVGELIDELGTELRIEDPVHFIEELGDVRWYEAIFLRHLNVTQEQVHAANIAKLEKRYPGNFDQFAALNRDLVAERKALEDNI